MKGNSPEKWATTNKITTFKGETKMEKKSKETLKKIRGIKSLFNK